ncbi:MAG: NUDIX hydrolase [Candidatus Woesearchaeota archaeon]
MALPNNAKLVFKGVMFDVYQWEQVQFDGSYKTFEAVKRKESVQLIAITPEKNILLLEEEQPFLGKYLSLVGGICESDDPRDDAIRELGEETGMVCEDLEFWQITGFSAKVIWNTTYFIARGCKKAIDIHLDAGERISVFELSFDEFVQKVLSDSFRNKEFANMVLKMIYENKLDEFKQFLLK